MDFGPEFARDRMLEIVQDNQGFLWVGTPNGLRRYDGHHLREYQHDPGNPNSLSSNFIYALFKDREGQIWIGAGQSLDRLNPATEVFTHYPLPAYSSEGWVSNIYQDHEGMLWLSTNRGLNRLNPATGQTIRHQHIEGDPSSLSDDRVQGTLESKDGTFWVATLSDLSMFDRPTGKVLRHFSLAKRQVVQEFFPGAFLCEDHTGTIWVAYSFGAGLASVDRARSKIIYYSIGADGSGTPLRMRATAIYEDEDGVLWLGTKDNGLLKLDRERRHIVRYVNRPDDPASLRASQLVAIYEDREGGMLVSTISGGADRFQRKPLPFKRYQHEPGNPNSLGSDAVFSALADHTGAIWVGSFNGLTRIDGKTGKVAVYRKAGGAGNLSGTWILSIAEDRSGALWFGTYQAGLNRLDPQSGRFTAYRHHAADPHSLSDDTVIALYLDRKGALWVGTINGLCRFDAQTGQFQQFKAPGEGPIAYRSIAEDAHGFLWLGTEGSGLRKLDPASGKFTKYTENATSSPGDHVNTVHVDKSGAVWVATAEGLNRLDPVNGALTTYTQRDGLPGNSVNNIEEDAAGNLWVGTGSGLSEFNPRTGIFKNFYVSDGLAGDDFTCLSSHQSPRGEMFFSTYTGVTSFFPDKIVEKIYPAPVVLTDFLLFGKPVSIGGNSPLKQAINSANSITLTHAQTIFTLEFAALSFADPARTRYRYMLEGLETQWNEANSTRRSAAYTNLDPGTYVFRVQARLNRGEWTEPGAQLRIVVLPPWWGTWWFRTLAAISLATLAWLAYYLRIRSIEGRNRELTGLNLELQRSQRNLQESEGKLAEAQQIAHVGHWSYESDTGRFDLSDETFRILGLPPQECVFDRDRILRMVHPEDRQRVDTLFESTLTGGRPYEVEHRVIRPNGEIRYVQLRGNPIADGVNRVLRIFGTIQDITERMRAEDTLRRLNRELRAISDCNEVLVRATDEQRLLNEICRIVCEKADYRMAWVGYAEHDDAKTVRPVAWAGDEDGYLETASIVWADTDCGRGPTGTSIRTGRPATVQDIATDPHVAPWREKALELGLRSCIALPLDNESGTVFGAFTIYSAEFNAFTTEETRLLEELAADMAFGITVLRGRIERNRAEDEIRQLNAELEERVRQRTAQLEAANKELESFGFTVSHDLRAPLRHISSFSRILMEEHGSQLPEDAQKLLERIEKGAVRLGSLIDDLLKLSRVGRQEMRLEAVSLEKLVNDVVEELAPDWTNRQVEWKIGALPTVQGEANLLRQVFQNLLANALKFSRGRSPAIIEIGEIPQEGPHLLFVRDNGVGFDMRYADKLFGAFQRLHSADKFEGTGIGLATVQRIVQRHGGRVWADAKVGEGATFFFTCG